MTDGAGGEAYGQSGGILLPEVLARHVLDEGIELSVAIDAHAGGRGIRDAQGAWGVLTRDLITRQEAFRIAVIHAFAPYFNAKMYGDPNAQRDSVGVWLDNDPASHGAPNQRLRQGLTQTKRRKENARHMDIVKGNMGWIEVIVGPMFSGKSEELIRRLRRAEIARQRVQIFKPAIDQRYADNGIVSHSGLGMRSDNVADAAEVLRKVEPRTEVIGIDEAQFLGDGLVEACTKLADTGKRVIVSGLDTDFLGRPFEPMPTLLAVAEEITKLLAICVRCGNPAVHTQRLVASEDLIVVGAGGMYEARCRRCFEPHLAHEQRRLTPQQIARRNSSASGATPVPHPSLQRDSHFDSLVSVGTTHAPERRRNKGLPLCTPTSKSSNAEVLRSAASSSVSSISEITWFGPATGCHRSCTPVFVGVG